MFTKSQHIKKILHRSFSAEFWCIFKWKYCIGTRHSDTVCLSHNHFIICCGLIPLVIMTMKEVSLDSLSLWSSACEIRMQIGNLNNISCTWNLPFYFGQVFGEVNFFNLGSREKIPMIGYSHTVTNIYFHQIHGLSLWAKSQPYFSTWCHIAQTIDFRVHTWFIPYNFIYFSMAHKKNRLLHEYFVYVATLYIRFNSQQKKCHVNYLMPLNFS